MPTQHPHAGAPDDDVFAAATELTAAMNRVSQGAPIFANPASVGPLLGALVDAQRQLSVIYAELHIWHASTVDGTHFTGYNDRGDETSRYRASIHCRTAAARGQAATMSLRRALSFNRALQWIDTGGESPEIHPDLVADSIYEHLCSQRAAQRVRTAEASEHTVREIVFAHNTIAHILGIAATDIISTAHEVLYLPTEQSAPVVLWSRHR